MTCFASRRRLPDTYAAIQLLADLRPGWTLTEIRGLSAREREHWLELARYHAERRHAPG